MYTLILPGVRLCLLLGGGGRSGDAALLGGAMGLGEVCTHTPLPVRYLRRYVRCVSHMEGCLDAPCTIHHTYIIYTVHCIYTAYTISPHNIYIYSALSISQGGLPVQSVEEQAAWEATVARHGGGSLHGS
jgi:hypothetical protein